MSTEVQVAVTSLPLVTTSDEAGEVKVIPWTREGMTAAAASEMVFKEGILGKRAGEYGQAYGCVDGL